MAILPTVSPLGREINRRLGAILLANTSKAFLSGDGTKCVRLNSALGGIVCQSFPLTIGRPLASSAYRSTSLARHNQDTISPRLNA